MKEYTTKSACICCGVERQPLFSNKFGYICRGCAMTKQVNPTHLPVGDTQFAIHDHEVARHFEEWMRNR